jgi:hypothetical protein
MAIRRFVVTAVTDSSGDATKYSPVLSGKLVSIRYVKTDYTDGVDFTITAEATGETLWTESNVNATAQRYPRAATSSAAGAASLYASGGTAVNDHVALGNDRVKIVVGSGGSTHTGAFHIVVDG